MMKLSEIATVETALGRLIAMVDTETDETRRRVLERVFDDFFGFVYSLYQKEYIENDIRNDTEQPF